MLVHGRCHHGDTTCILRTCGRTGGRHLVGGGAAADVVTRWTRLQVVDFVVHGRSSTVVSIVHPSGGRIRRLELRGTHKGTR